MNTYTDTEVKKIINKCFDLGQGGWTGEGDKQEYTEMVDEYCKELILKRRNKTEKD